MMVMLAENMLRHSWKYETKTPADVIFLNMSFPHIVVKIVNNFFVLFLISSVTEVKLRNASYFSLR